MQFISKYRQKRMFYRILIVLMAMSLSMFAVVYFFVYRYLYNSFQERSVAIQHQMLSSSSMQIDRALKEITSTMEQMLYNQDVVSMILLPEEADYLKRSAVVKTLQNFERNNSLVASAYLVIYNQGTVYDSNGSVRFIEDSFCQPFLQEDIARAVSLKDNGSRSSMLVTIDRQAAVLQQFPTPEKNGAILVLLDMYELFSPIVQSDSGNVQIVSSNGNLIYPLIEEDEREETIKPFSVSFASSITNWSYNFIGPVNSESFGINRIIIITAPLAIVFLLVSIFLSTNITYHIYRPINRLFQMAMDSDTSQGNTSGKDELSFVQNAYANAMEQRDAMSKKLVNIAPTIREKLYKNLLFGREMSESYVRETLSSSHSPFNYDDMFMVMTLAATTFQGEDCSELETNLIYRGLEHLIPSLMTDLRFDWVVTDQNHFIFILGFDADTSIISIKNMMIRLEKDILGQIKETGFRLFAGISKPSSGISNLFYCYELAEKDLNYQRYQCFEESTTIESQRSESFDDQDQQSEIIQLVIDGNRRSADAALESFIHLAQSESKNVDELKLRFDHMLDAMTERLVSFRATEQEMAEFEQYYSIQPPFNVNELMDVFYTAAQCALSSLGVYGQKNQNRYIRQAKDYIAQHCSDSDLSLSKVAAYIGINPNYLSRLFYSSGEDNFVDTLNISRIENAKLLLRQTGIPIKEIGFKTGFNSMQSFNRVFKKYTGTTPSCYRKEKEGGL